MNCNLKHLYHLLWAKLYLRRKFRKQSRSTRFGISRGRLDGLRLEIEQNREWAHASIPSFRDSWKRLWLWVYLRRKIKSAPPTAPYMKQIGPRHWKEISPGEELNPWTGEPEDCSPLIKIRPESITDSIPKDYWKTHEPVFSEFDPYK